MRAVHILQLLLMSGMRKDIKSNWSTCTACMNPGKSLIFQLRQLEKNHITVFDRAGKKIELQRDLSRKLIGGNITAEQCMYPCLNS